MSGGSAFDSALDAVTRVRGVRGAMLVARPDGLVVAEQLMEGVKGGAVAALAASVTVRLQRAMATAGLGSCQFWHLQCDQGSLLAVPVGDAMLVVAVTEPEVNVGLVRLELLRVAESAG